MAEHFQGNSYCGSRFTHEKLNRNTGATPQARLFIKRLNKAIYTLVNDSDTPSKQNSAGTRCH
jgi:hypothetical protein